MAHRPGAAGTTGSFADELELDKRPQVSIDLDSVRDVELLVLPRVRLGHSKFQRSRSDAPFRDIFRFPGSSSGSGWVFFHNPDTSSLASPERREPRATDFEVFFTCVPGCLLCGRHDLAACTHVGTRHF
jgi:hypothetical protein